MEHYKELDCQGSGLDVAEMRRPLRAVVYSLIQVTPAILTEVKSTRIGQILKTAPTLNRIFLLVHEINNSSVTRYTNAAALKARVMALDLLVEVERK